MIKLQTVQKLKSKGTVYKYIDRNFDGSIGNFLEDIDKSINNLLRIDLKKTGKFIECVKLIFKYLPKDYTPRLWAIDGRFNNWSGNYFQALKSYKKSIKLYSERNDTEAIARTGKGLMDVCTYLGRYNEALEIGQRSLSYYRRKKRLTDVGQVLNNIGNIYHRMDNNRMALKNYDKARQIFQKGGGVPLAIIEYNRGNVYSNMNQLRQAEKLYLASAELYRQTGMKIAENQAIYSLAYLYFLEDRYTEAIKIFESVYEEFSNLGDRKSALITLLDLAEINIQLNQYGSAIMLADQIIPELHQLGMKYEEAKAHYFASEARIRLGDYSAASHQLKKARVLFNKEGNSLWLGMIYISHSKLYMARKRFSLAIKSATEAIHYFNKSGDERRKIDAEISRLDAILHSGNAEGALKKVHTISKKKLVSYQSYNLNCLAGQCHYQLKNYSAALRDFKSGVTIIEKMLIGLYPDEIRYFFVIDKYECYKMMIECLIRLGRIHDSFIANLKTLDVINHRVGDKIELNAEIPADLAKIRNELRASLKKMTKLPENTRRSSAGTVSYYKIEQKLWSNERKIRSILYPNCPAEYTLKARKYDYRSLIKNGEILLNFFTSNTIIGAFYATKDKTGFVEFNTTPSELDQLLRKLSFILESAVYGSRNYDRVNQIAKNYLEEVYTLIFEPLSEYITGNKIYITADGRFGQIPFNALRDNDGKYLKDKYHIRLIINPDDLKSGRITSKHIIKGSSAVFAASSNKLPMIEKEAIRINKMFGKSRLYLNEKANCRNLADELNQDTGFIHIAAHASRSSENPLFSRILLNDGPFFPFDLFKLGVKADLITLSGCQTAAPGLYYGNSFSLAKAFYQAGAGLVLASLWPVSDRISMIFMTEFYQELNSKNNIFEAYNSAVNEVMKITDNPAFWSSFILLGL